MRTLREWLAEGYAVTQGLPGARSRPEFLAALQEAALPAEELKAERDRLQGVAGRCVVSRVHLVLLRELLEV